MRVLATGFREQKITPMNRQRTAISEVKLI
jgi:hypothetical protein